MTPTLQSLRPVDADTAEVVIRYADGPKTYRLTVFRAALEVLEGTGPLYADLSAWPAVYDEVLQRVGQMLVPPADRETGAA